MSELHNVLNFAKQRLEACRQRLSSTDREVNAIYHEIENTRFNAKQGYDYAIRLKEALCKRRAIKNDMASIYSILSTKQEQQNV